MTGRLHTSEPATEGPVVAEVTPPSRSIPHRASTWALLIGFAALGLVRLWLLRQGNDQLLVLDEAGYVANARLFAGGYPDAVMPDMTYSVGYALFLAPVAALVDDAARLHAIGVVLNVVLVGAVPAVVHAWLRDIGFRNRHALPAAAVAGLYPALTLGAGVLWVESFATLLFCLWALTFTRAITGTPVNAVGAGVAAAWLGATHPRFVAMPAVAIAAFYLAGRRESGLWRVRRIGILTTIVAAALLHVATLTAQHRLYVTGLGSELSFARSILRGDISLYLRLAVTHAWYLVIASVGVAAVGAVTLGRLWRTGPTAVGFALSASIGSVFAISFVTPGTGLSKVTGETVMRADFLVYGRYNEPWLVLLVALGVAAVLAKRRRDVGLGAVVAVAVLIVGGVILVAGYPDKWVGGPVNKPNIFALLSELRMMGKFRPGGLTFAYLAAIVAMTVLAASRFRLVIVAVLAVLFFADVHHGIRSWQRPAARFTAPNRHLADVVSDLPGVQRVAFAPGTEGTLLYLMQYWAPHEHYRILDDLDDLDDLDEQPVPQVYVSHGTNPEVPPGARLLDVETNLLHAVWVLPGPLADSLAAAGRLAPPDPTSRLPAEAARAHIGLAPQDLSVGSEEDVAWVVTVTHAGTGRPWRRDGGGITADGTVYLALQISRCGETRTVGTRRYRLPTSLGPGMIAPITVTLPRSGERGSLRPGCYDVEANLVQVNGARFGAAQGRLVIR